MRPRVRPFGEAALLVEFGDGAHLSLNARVHQLAANLETDPPADLRNVVPGYVSLLVEFDPLQVDLEAEEERLRDRLSSVSPAPAASPAPPRSIPTVYGGESGPDLEHVAARVGWTPEQVIQRHTDLVQTVYMLGFAAGFPYMGDLPPDLELPRRETPRDRVPIGSVAIAGRQTGIYSRETPGGWHLIGRTPIDLFDPGHEPPVYLRPGARVRFFAISPAEWERYRGPAGDW